MQLVKENSTNEKKMKRLNVVSLQMIKERTFPFETNTIRDPKSVFKLVQEFIGYEDREHCILICLDTKNRITSIQTIAIGSLNAAIIHPRECMKLAILSNSASIILAHCHPSFDPSPSYEDLELTKRLKAAGELIGIELIDHVIVGGENHYSLKENGHL